jgi:hypothetical protein
MSSPVVSGNPPVVVGGNSLHSDGRQAVGKALDQTFTGISAQRSTTRATLYDVLGTCLSSITITFALIPDVQICTRLKKAESYPIHDGNFRAETFVLPNHNGIRQSISSASAGYELRCRQLPVVPALAPPQIQAPCYRLQQLPEEGLRASGSGAYSSRAATPRPDQLQRLPAGRRSARGARCHQLQRLPEEPARCRSRAASSGGKSVC